MFLVDWFYFTCFHLIRAILDLLIVVASPVLVFLYGQKQGSKNRSKFKAVLITGGSDGLGAGLVQEFSKNENVKTIIVTGTNEAKLQKLEDVCKSSKKASEGRKIITKCVNVANEEEMKSFIDEMDKQHQIDLVIANAGVNISTIKDVYYCNSVRDTVKTNILGAMNVITPMIANFQERKKRGGHIAIIGDMQGYSSISYNGPYAGQTE
ncbi:hypothetical protein RFI_26348 [Reticulomyxa filosa]|uniref:Uncharacterized protein n=1 Tax=Reticulomyxa filosa TaxID=46433 RepID=X6MAJ5_RETFI|nr:hypothetical protein RFI_26348 [Reticulomyxa filosa]|eukprot:ETO11028.1 hypothetical protein RFI_26348 [Reticulomyxa filosa]